MNTKKKILMIPSWYPTGEHPGVGDFFQQQSVLLQERYDVRVIYGYSPYLEHKTLYGRYKKLLKQKAKTTYDDLNDPVPTIRFTYGNWWFSERLLINEAIRKYVSEVKKLISNGWKPDVLHAQSAEIAGIVTAKLSEEFKIPWVLTEHQVFALANYSLTRQNLIKQALKTPKFIAAVSQHQLRCIAIHNINKPMTNVGNFIDENHFPLSESKKTSGLFRILTVTWPSAIKDPETFFQALAVLIKKGHKDIEATVIGKKLFSINDTSDFELLAEKFKVREYCKFIPEIPHEKMPEAYADSDVFVSTSVAETFGIAVREAMAVGKPVVCTASGGVDDDIFDFNGFKVNIYDYEAIANSIIAIKTGAVTYDPDKIRQYVVSRYGRQAFLDRYSAIFDQVLNSDHNEPS